MFLLKKLITPMLLPPGIVIGLLAITGMWSLLRKNRGLAVVCWTAAALLGLLSSGMTAHWMMARLESGLRPPAVVEADVIIMLGAGVYEGAPDLSGRGAPGPESMLRLMTAARLNRRFSLPIIVSGGKVHRHSGAVATVAGRFLQDLGIGSEEIILEGRSRDTHENARFSAEICRSHGFRRPLLVTSGYHMPRAVMAFESAGLPVTPYPCGLTTWPGKRLTAWHLLPTAHALNLSAMALHEWFGTLYYRWRHPKAAIRGSGDVAPGYGSGMLRVARDHQIVAMDDFIVGFGS